MRSFIQLSLTTGLISIALLQGGVWSLGLTQQGGRGMLVAVAPLWFCGRCPAPQVPTPLR